MFQMDLTYFSRYYDNLKNNFFVTDIEDDSDESLEVLRTLLARIMMEKISVTIEDSDTASTVAQKIYDAGLISSKSEFEEYITSSGKESSIKAGTYEIPISSLQEEILNIITE